MQQNTDRIKIRFEDIACLILLLYPLRKVNMGIDLMDAGYSLGNYQYFDVMNPTWKLATYYANLLGRFLQWLPIGDTWIGMNIYTGLLIGIVAAGAYRYLCHTWRKEKHLLFIAELVAISLCWAPSTILYHYLGYFLMTAAVMLLVRAIKREKTAYFIIAGVILGACVLVRMPNVTYVALIIPVWYGQYLYRDADTNWLQSSAKQTGFCILGYLIGVLPPLIFISIRYGISAYPDMITSLFGMTDKATDYKPISMLTSMLGDYGQYSIWLLLFFLYFISGVILFKIKAGKWETVKKAVYCLGLLVLLRFCYGRGMFDFDYRAYFSMYKWITVYLLATILLCGYLIVNRQVKREHKLWAGFLLTIILITPLGSNNALYPIINNLFLVVPVSVCLFYQNMQTYRNVFPMKAVAVFVAGCVCVQSVLFGIGFVFHDVAVSQQDWVKAEIPGSDCVQGMHTTVDKNTQLAELGGYLQENGLRNHKVLLYGDIPAIAYLFDLEPAVYTTWADLDSNSLERLEADLADIQEPVLVILSSEVGEKLEQLLAGEVSNQADEKLEAIAGFVERDGYQCSFENEAYYVLTCK